MEKEHRTRSRVRLARRWMAGLCDEPGSEHRLRHSCLPRLNRHCRRAVCVRFGLHLVSGVCRLHGYRPLARDRTLRKKQAAGGRQKRKPFKNDFRLAEVGRADPLCRCSSPFAHAAVDARCGSHLCIVFRPQAVPRSCADRTDACRDRDRLGHARCRRCRRWIVRRICVRD